MKVQISSTRIVKDALTVWNEAGPEVDVVMDVKNLTFREGMIDELYTFHILEHLFDNEIPQAIENWRKCVKKGGEIYILSDDFENLARLFVGGELNIFDFNSNFSYPTKITRENLTQYLRDAQFSDNDMRIWYVDVPDLFTKKDHELVISVKKI